MSQVVHFNGVRLEVLEHEKSWALSDEQVAEGFGVARGAIRKQRTQGKTEYKEGVHFFYQSVTNRAGSSTSRNKTFWTKKGVITLGFKLRETPQTIAFRDWASDFILMPSYALVEEATNPLTVYEKIRSLPLETYKDVRIAKEFGEFLVSTFGKRAALPLLCDFLGLPNQPSPSEELREQEKEDSDLEEWVKNNITYIEGARGFLSEFHAAYLKHGGKQGANQLAKAIIKITGVRPQSKRINGIVRKIYYDLGLNEAITVIPN